MKVFYINIENFKKHIDKSILCEYADISINAEKRFYEYTIGRYLIKSAAKKIYDIDDEIIINKNGKPQFKNNEIYFSLSHSKNIEIVCFYKAPCGIDIEFMKNRNLEKVSEYFGQKFDTLEDFYKFWTAEEAEYKIGEKAFQIYSCRLKNYWLSIASNKKFDDNIEITEFCF